MARTKKSDTMEAAMTASGSGAVPKFQKEQLLKSNRYNHRQDVLAALLEEHKTYSLAEVDKLINEFLERKVR